MGAGHRFLQGVERTRLEQRPAPAGGDTPKRRRDLADRLGTAGGFLALTGVGDGGGGIRGDLAELLVHRAEQEDQSDAHPGHDQEAQRAYQQESLAIWRKIGEEEPGEMVKSKGITVLCITVQMV